MRRGSKACGQLFEYGMGFQAGVSTRGRLRGCICGCLFSFANFLEENVVELVQKRYV